jgi:putative transposase
VKYAWIANHIECFDLNVMFAVLEVPKSSYFSWLNVDHHAKEAPEQSLHELVIEAFDDLEGNASTRGIRGYLLHEFNIRVSRRKIGIILNAAGLQVKRRRKFRKPNVAPMDDPRIAGNLLKRQFNVSRPNQIWVGDITEIRTTQGKGYLAAYIDLFSRKVVGWSFDNHMRSDLVETALKRALWQRKPPKGLMVHTDQGRQFISDHYLTLLKSLSLKSSMSRRGNCWDNAVIESFFKTLKTEEIYQLPKLLTHQETLWQIQEFIGHYNHKRPHSKNDYLAPAKFEKLHREQAEAKAKDLGTKKC